MKIYIWGGILSDSISFRHQAGGILRDNLKKTTEGLQQEYFSPNELSLEMTQDDDDDRLIFYVPFNIV